MMHSAIVYAVMPEHPDEARQVAAALLAGIARLGKSQAVQQLGEFVWQVNFQAEPESLALLITALDRQGISYGILPLADEPQWIDRDPTKAAG